MKAHFRMGSFFKFGQAVPAMERIYLSEMAPKRRFLKGLFCNFLGINTHNFVKIDPNFENNSLFDAKFYRASHENISRSQSCDIWGVGPKN